MRISFYGACREVTGSNILLESGSSKILLDCGLFQGSNLSEERNYSSFGFKPADISCVITCHAHLDHTGRLPKLVKEGFSGRIFATEPTRELTQLVLEDSEKLMREAAERNNHPTLYDKRDIEKVMSLFEVIDYEKKTEVVSGIFVTLKNAGHILGSAIAVIELEGKKLIYTSDLGNTPSQLLEPPAFIEEGDIVICESTYGGRIHEDIGTRKTKLAQIIAGTIKENAVLIIPSFAIERTQELLHDIEDFCMVEGCEKPTFYLDSPLAQKVTAVFKKYPKFLRAGIFKEHEDADIFGLERLKITGSVEDSKQIRNAPNPKVIIAGSGMMNGGRILYHARDFLGDAQNRLLIVGYQSQNTLGRRILDGEKQIKILGRLITVRAGVLAIGSYSAHADSLQMVSWLEKIKGLKQVFLVHGEGDQMLALSETIKNKLNIESKMPQLGESFEV